MELGENVTGSVNNFPSMGITCLGNLAVFVTCLIRGRLDLEMCARDILATARGPRLQKIKENSEHGLTTCRGPLQAASVVILSNGIHNSSIRQFVESSALNVDSILLQLFPLKAAEVTVEMCHCTSCHCIVFWTVEEITKMLARVMPGTLKQLPYSNFCLLPSPTCLKNGCHGCNHGLLRWEVTHETEAFQVGRWTYETYQGPDVHVVCKLLGSSSFAGNSICICIPVHHAEYDGWTNQLAICLRSKDVEGRGVGDMASRAMEEYLDYGRGEEGEVKYSILSFLMPRLTEMLINIVLTFWFRVDGFSSALVARRAIRDYLVDSKGSGFAANTFLTKAVVMSDYNNQVCQVCQVLTFRGTLLGPRTLSFIMGCVNLICSIGWAVLIAFDGGADSSSPPSKLGIIVIVLAIGIALAMDSFHLYFNFNYSAKFYYPGEHGENQAAQHERAVPFEPTPALTVTIVRQTRTQVMVLSVIVLEIACIVSCSAVAGVLGTKGFGRWLYGALQGLVWVKWGIGSYVLSEYSPEFFGDNPDIWKIIIYSSAFMLNAVLAGVRCKCGPWPWKDNHLF